MPLRNHVTTECTVGRGCAGTEWCSESHTSANTKPISLHILLFIALRLSGRFIRTSTTPPLRCITCTCSRRPAMARTTTGCTRSLCALKRLCSVLFCSVLFCSVVVEDLKAQFAFGQGVVVVRVLAHTARETWPISSHAFAILADIKANSVGRPERAVGRRCVTDDCSKHG